MEVCVFCGAECKIHPSQGAATIYGCPNCGFWQVSHSYAGNFNSFLRGNYADKKHLIASYLYEFNRERTEPYLFTAESLEKLMSDERIPRTPMQRIERFLVNLYKTDDTIGKIIRINNNGQGWGIAGSKYNLLPLSYAKDETELMGMFNCLSELGYMAKTKQTANMDDFYISPKGFERAEQLMSTNIDSKSVFVAMAFREDLIEACNKAIKPACEICGFNARLISDTHHNNGITDEIMVEIKRSKFVIVDFTYNNNGAYYEAGYAQGLGRTIIRCCKKEWFDNPGDDKGLHFDVRHYNTILWENHDDLYEKLKNNIIVNIDGAILSTK
jgi:nucleoside 2-deoxyribosyltransferase